MHAGKDFHRHVTRIVAHKFLVDFENAFQLAIEHLAIDVRQVEVNHRLSIDAEVVLVDDLEDRTRCDVAWNQVAVLRIPLLEEVPALIGRNALRIALISGLLRNPHAPAFTTRRLRHQPQLVFAGDRSWVHLNEFAIRVERALLIERALRGPGAYNRVRRLPENHADPAGGHDYRISREGAHFHRAQIHRADAAANLISVQYRGEEFPVLELVNLTFGLVATHLLVERIEKLLTGRRTRKSRPVEERSAEATEIEQPFSCAIEGNSHAVEQIDDARRGIAHSFYRRLVRQKIAAVNGVVEVLPRRVAFALQVLGSVDAALRAHRMRALHGDNREQINLAAHFGHFDHGSESRQAAAYYNDLRIDCHV